ncbi:YcfA-like protein [bacterium BMS3Abin03]|nr:YcfA-like protein [bacterium BMS3Abin03]
MKIPRDINGKEIIRKLRKLGYEQTRQSGSHIRLTATIEGKKHHITIPNHNPIKIGTLNNILKDVALHHNKSKDEIIKSLF